MLENVKKMLEKIYCYMIKIIKITKKTIFQQKATYLKIMYATKLQVTARDEYYRYILIVRAFSTVTAFSENE